MVRNDSPGRHFQQQVLAIEVVNPCENSGVGGECIKMLAKSRKLKLREEMESQVAQIRLLFYLFS
jgi:hypothetical protein